MISPYFEIMMQDDAVLESMIEMRNAQPTRDRMHYFDKVMEGSTETNAALFQKLYTDILSKSNIDYGDIPNSTGALLKYRGYPLLQETIDKINTLYKGISSEEVTTMNKLHDMIIDCKKDYETGFTYDIELIKIIYNTSVLTLYELINLCIISYTKIMRKNAKIEVSFITKKKSDLSIYNNAKSLVKMYESGQWKRIMKEFHKNPTMFSGTGGAMEAKFSVGGLLKAISDAPNIIKIPVAIVAGVIMLLVIVRQLVYWFYCGASKVNEYIKTQKQFVDVVIAQEKVAGESTEVIEKHSAIADKLSSITNFIEVKILHSDKESKAKIVESDKQNYSVKDFSSSPSPSSNPSPTSNYGLNGGNVEF